MSMTSLTTCQRFQDFLTQDQKLLHKTTEFLRILTQLLQTAQSVPMSRDKIDHSPTTMECLPTTDLVQVLSHQSRMSQLLPILNVKLQDPQEPLVTMTQSQI